MRRLLTSLWSDKTRPPEENAFGKVVPKSTKAEPKYAESHRSHLWYKETPTINAADTNLKSNVYSMEITAKDDPEYTQTVPFSLGNPSGPHFSAATNTKFYTIPIYLIKKDEASIRIGLFELSESRYAKVFANGNDINTINVDALPDPILFSFATKDIIDASLISADDYIQHLTDTFTKSKLGADVLKVLPDNAVISDADKATIEAVKLTPAEMEKLFNVGTNKQPDNITGGLIQRENELNYNQVEKEYKAAKEKNNTVDPKKTKKIIMPIQKLMHNMRFGMEVINPKDMAGVKDNDTTTESFFDVLVTAFNNIGMETTPDKLKTALIDKLTYPVCELYVTLYNAVYDTKLSILNELTNISNYRKELHASFAANSVTKPDSDILYYNTAEGSEKYVMLINEQTALKKQYNKVEAEFDQFKRDLDPSYNEPDDTAKLLAYQKQLREIKSKIDQYDEKINKLTTQTTMIELTNKIKRLTAQFEKLQNYYETDIVPLSNSVQFMGDVIHKSKDDLDLYKAREIDLADVTKQNELMTGVPEKQREIMLNHFKDALKKEFTLSDIFINYLEIMLNVKFIILQGLSDKKNDKQTSVELNCVNYYLPSSAHFAPDYYIMMEYVKDYKTAQYNLITYVYDVSPEMMNIAVEDPHKLRVDEFTYKIFNPNILPFEMKEYIAKVCSRDGVLSGTFSRIDIFNDGTFVKQVNDWRIEKLKQASAEGMQNVSTNNNKSVLLPDNNRDIQQFKTLPDDSDIQQSETSSNKLPSETRMKTFKTDNDEDSDISVEKKFIQPEPRKKNWWGLFGGGGGGKGQAFDLTEYIVNAKTTNSMQPPFVLTFSNSAATVVPGKAPTDYVPLKHQQDFIDLRKTTNWRRKLADDWTLEPPGAPLFKLDGRNWASVEHYCHAIKYKRSAPDFYFTFTLDSGSKMSKKPAMARAAASSAGTYKGTKLRRDDITKGDCDPAAHARALFAKFSQNVGLAMTLLDTNSAILAQRHAERPLTIASDLMTVRDKLDKLTRTKKHGSKQ